ncbi:MAG: hypothetical protein ACI9TH_002818 [Kiritimatiellia bacterium]|jgi:hypothetical protein
MRYQNEFQLGTRSLERHVKVTLGIGLAPMILAGSFIVSVQGWDTPLMYFICGFSLGLWMVLWGLHEIMFTPQVHSRIGQMMKTKGPKWFPFMLLVFRYTFFILTFIIIGKTASWVGMTVTPWMKISYITLLVLTPIAKLINKLVPDDLRKWQDVCIEVFRRVYAICLVLFGLGMANMLFLTEEAKASGSAHPLYLLIWVLGVIVILSILILLLDYVTRYDNHHK